jgi:hypothetical protein
LLLTTLVAGLVLPALLLATLAGFVLAALLTTLVLLAVFQTFAGARGMSALCHKRTHAMQRFCHYSITKSARPSSGSGMARPRVLAVFRLMTSSTLAAC